MKSHGIGVGYRYPHDHPGADVEQQYLPDPLRERRYYSPSAEGMERLIGERLERLRVARGAAREEAGTHQRDARG
jgi:putative ATPase